MTIYDDDGGNEQHHYVCDEDGSAADGEDAGACADLVNQQRFLLEGEPEGTLCTGVYGGPETATIEGAVDGETFVRNVDRTDGCGIQRWDDLSGALGEPAAQPFPEP